MPSVARLPDPRDNDVSFSPLTIPPNPASCASVPHGSPEIYAFQGVYTTLRPETAGPIQMTRAFNSIDRVIGFSNSYMFPEFVQKHKSP